MYWAHHVRLKHLIPSIYQDNPILSSPWNEGSSTRIEAADIRNKFWGTPINRSVDSKTAGSQRDCVTYQQRATFRHKRIIIEKLNHIRNQLELLKDSYFPGRNEKLSPRFIGPHLILQLKGESVVVIKMLNSGRKTTVHVNRLKPYHVPPEQVENNDDTPKLPPSAPPLQLPPQNPQSFQLPPVPLKDLIPYEPVAGAGRTKSKNPNLSPIFALNKAPRNINSAEEGVQKICEMLIGETESEQWILVIKKPKLKIQARNSNQ